MQNVNNENISSMINAPVLMSEIEDLILRQNETNENIGLFTLKTANKWVDQAKKRPIPKMLFDEFCPRSAVAPARSRRTAGGASRRPCTPARRSWRRAW